MSIFDEMDGRIDTYLAKINNLIKPLNKFDRKMQVIKFKLLAASLDKAKRYVLFECVRGALSYGSK